MFFRRMLTNSFRTLFIMLAASLLLLACGDTNDDSQNSNAASLSVSIGNPTPRFGIAPRALHSAIPENINSIVIRVWQSGQLLESADILIAGGSLTLSVPSGVKLLITGTAYSENEIVNRGSAEIGPLSPRESASVPLELEEFGPGAPKAKQVDIVNGISGNGDSKSAIFFNGNDSVLFQSTSDNLVQLDRNSKNNLYVKAIAESDSIVNIHSRDDGESGNGPIGSASISKDGKFAVFSSDADNLIDTSVDDNSVRDVFLKDLETNVVKRLSELPEGAQSTQASYEPDISEDGSHIVFVSDEALLQDSKTGIFWFDRNTGQLVYIGPGRMPQVSGNGKFVVAWNPLENQLLRYPLQENAEGTVLVAPYFLTSPTDRIPYAVSHSGEQVAYTLQLNTPVIEVKSDELTQEKSDGSATNSDIYFYDFTREKDRIRLLTLNQEGVPVEKIQNSSNPAISSDARYVVFTNGTAIHVKATFDNELATPVAYGTLPTLSPDGRKIAFTAKNQKLYTIDNPLFAEINAETATKPQNASVLLNVGVEGDGSGYINSTSGSIDCGETCEAAYPQGTLLQLDATPDDEIIFTGWSGICESFGNASSIQLSVNSDTQCNAKFSATQFGLTLTLESGEGGGSVTSSDTPPSLTAKDCKVGANSKTICHANIPIGETITLIPTLDENTDGIHWIGCDQDNGLEGCVVTIDEPRLVTAAFNVSTHLLSLSKTGTGSGHIKTQDGGIDCGEKCAHEFINQSQVTLTVTPDKTSLFTGWSGDAEACKGKDTSISILMDNAHKCAANFELNTVELAVSLTGEGNGTIESKPSGILCGEDCKNEYIVGSVVNLTAKLGDNSEFLGWSGACSGKDANVSVTMDEAKSCIAEFGLIELGLIVKLAGNGSGVVTSEPAGIICGGDCSESYDFGTQVKLIAKANEGSIFAGWSGDCSGESDSTSITIEETKNCEATFILKQFTVSVSKTGNGSGIVISEPTGINCGEDCDHQYDFGSKVSLIATPDAESVFVEWAGDCSGKDTSLIITVEKALNCEANFKLKQFTLDVNKSGTGSGNISSEPTGINCGEDCSETYNFSTNVKLTATPTNDSTFIGWSGSCSGGDKDIIVVIDEAKSCEAKFDLKKFTLTVNKIGNGIGNVSSEPGSINCGSTCSDSFNIGSQVNLVATADSNSVFTGWSGACSGSSNSANVTLNEAKTCEANFVLKQFSLGVTKTGNGSGNVSSEPGGISCGSDCSEQYNKDAQVTLFATPSDDSRFEGWSGACSGTDTRVSVVVDVAKNCEAKFTLIQFNLTVNKSGEGVITSAPTGINCGSDCNHDYTVNTNVTLTANPAGDWNFAGWSGACSGAKDSLTAKVTMDQAKSCDAKFTIKTPLLTVTKSGNGKVTSSPGGIDCGNACSQNYTINTEVTLSANPASDSNFAGWSGACTGTNRSFTLKMDQAKSCEAKFTKKQFQLTVTKSGNGTVTSSPSGINCGSDCKQDYTINTDVTLTAAPGGDSNFSNWSGACSGSSRSVTVKMDQAKSCEAKFTKKLFQLTVTKSGNGTVTSSPSGISCGSDCKHDYVINTDVTLTADPASDSNFAGWGGACSGTNRSFTIKMDQARSCEAKFTKKQFQLTVTKSGNGTVTSSPGGISCGSDCNHNYTINTDVTLTADPGGDSNFSGWSGACSGSNRSVTIKMDQAKSCEAKFSLKKFKLTVNKSGNGTVTSQPTGINCGSDCNQDYTVNTSVTLTADPASDSNFAGWGGACSGAEKSLTATVKMDKAKSCDVSFTLKKFNLSVKKTGSGNGTVTSNPSGINCGSDCSQNYTINTSVTLTADPGSNSDFAGWAGACSSADKSLTVSVKMDQAKTCEAKFDLKERWLRILLDGNGSGSVSSDPAGIKCGTDCGHNYVHGTVVKLTATANTGSDFDRWGGDCRDLQGSTISVTMNKATTCDAFFKLETKQLTVTITGSGNGVISSNPAGIDCGKDCSQSYNYGTVVTLTAKPVSGSFFNGWSGNCSGSKSTVSITVNSNKKCTAKFDLSNDITNISLDPVSPGTRFTGSNVNITFNYRTNQSAGVRIWARPFTDGALTPNYAASPSPVHPVGSGSGEQWFTINSPAKVDQIRFRMVNAETKALILEKFISVDYTFYEKLIILQQDQLVLSP